MDSHKYFSLSYKVIWQESVDFCKIPLGESKWILINISVYHIKLYGKNPWIFAEIPLVRI